MKFLVKFFFRWHIPIFIICLFPFAYFISGIDTGYSELYLRYAKNILPRLACDVEYISKYARDYESRYLFAYLSGVYMFVFFSVCVSLIFFLNIREIRNNFKVKTDFSVPLASVFLFLLSFLTLGFIPESSATGDNCSWFYDYYRINGKFNYEISKEVLMSGFLCGGMYMFFVLFLLWFGSVTSRR